MDATAAREWLDAYGRAWEERDPHLVEPLFTADATYAENPFDEPFRGTAAIRHYWSDVPRSQEDVRFGHDVVAVQDGLVVARWWASFTRIGSGEQVELDGIFMLRFAADGRCRELREWWHARDTELGAA